MTTRKPFDRSREWKIVGRDPRIRFRPRLPPVGETIEVTLPVALSAVEGRLAATLGDAYATCLALTSLRLGPGNGALDLMLLARSGAVALGECKLVKQTGAHSAARGALIQLARYAAAIRQRRAKWLWERYADSYDRFGFGEVERFVGALGVKTDADRCEWWKTIEGTLYRGDFDLFTAVRARGELHIDVWSRSRLAVGR